MYTILSGIGKREVSRYVGRPKYEGSELLGQWLGGYIVRCVGISVSR
jgi:hypothetical protein